MSYRHQPFTVGHLNLEPLMVADLWRRATGRAAGPIQNNHLR